MPWPDNSDGDVFRRLQSSKFDFASACEIEFNVDFSSWPPSIEAMQWLEEHYKQVKSYPAADDFKGYVLFKVRSLLTYELVVKTQEEVSRSLAQYGGICESWGILHG